jgi:hypothetical protein
MFVEELRRAAEAAPRCELPRVRETLWKAYGQGLLADDDAQAMAELIEARLKTPAVAPQRVAQRRVGSRPRTSASLERRRSWAASGALPPQLACRFTIGEQAVLAVIAMEVRKKGRCALAMDHIAALAGVCRTTVRNALREAGDLGLIKVIERRLTAWRNDTNLIDVVSPEWLSWLERGPKRGGQGGGVKTVRSTASRFSDQRESWGKRHRLQAAGRQSALRSGAS